MEIKLHKLVNKRIVIANLCGLAVLAFFFLSFQVPNPQIHNIEPVTPFVSYVDTESSLADQTLVEQVALFDSEPLFLPTSRNAQIASPLQEHQSHINSLFNLLEPELFIQKLGPELLQPLSDSPIQSPMQTLEDSQVKPFEYFGRYEIPVNRLPERIACVTVRPVNSNEIIFQQDITADKPFSTNSFWKPVNFMVLIENHECIGNPLMLNTSGEESIDTFLKNYITESPELKNLKPGYYKVTLGP